MNRKEKTYLKDIIGESIDLSTGRYKDEEVTRLHDLISNIDEYEGASKTYRHSFTDWCSDGKYTRDEETTYTLKNENNRISIEEKYSYHDDDGQTGGHTLTHETGRAILGLLGKIFDD